MTSLDVEKTRQMFDNMSIPKLKTAEDYSWLRLRLEEPLTIAEVLAVGDAVKNSRQLKEFLSKDDLEEVSEYFGYYATRPWLRRHWLYRYVFDEQSPKSAIKIIAWLLTGPAIEVAEVKVCVRLKKNIFSELLLTVITPLTEGKIGTCSSYCTSFFSRNDRCLFVFTNGSDVVASSQAVLQHVSELNKIGLFIVTLLVQESIYEEFDREIIKALKTLPEEFDDEDHERPITNKKGAKIVEINKNLSILYDLFCHHPTKAVRIAPFRTAIEALQLSTRIEYVQASIWGSDMAINLAIAGELECFNVFINSQTYNHPSIPAYPAFLYSTSKKRYASNVGGNRTKALLKLLEIERLKPYEVLIKRWLTIEELSFPTGVCVISKFLGPAGVLDMRWKTGLEYQCMSLCIAALSCGNEVNIHQIGNSGELKNVLQEIKEEFSEKLSFFLEDIPYVIGIPISPPDFCISFEGQYIFKDNISKDLAVDDKDFMTRILCQHKCICLPKNVPL